MVVGPTGGGKTQNIYVLARSLTKAHNTLHAQEQDRLKLVAAGKEAPPQNPDHDKYVSY